MTDEEMAEFDAVFVPGGHGPMVDLADNPDATRLLQILHRKGATVASLCHGPAALLAAGGRDDGQWLFEGYRLTSFTDEEEDQTVAGKLGMPWYLDTALKNAGAVFDDAPVGVGVARRRRPQPDHRAEPRTRPTPSPTPSSSPWRSCDRGARRRRGGLFRALGDRDADAALALLAPDAEVDVLPAGSTTSMDPAAAGRAFFAATVEAFPDLRSRSHRTTELGDGVVLAEIAHRGHPGRRLPRRDQPGEAPRPATRPGC